MENLLLLVHLITAVAIIGLILLQQGKGAEMGASFGSGASQTLFGATGSGNFFSRMTAIFATVFFITSFTLAVIAKQKTQVDEDIPVVPAVEQMQDIPAGEDTSDVPSVESDIPTVQSQLDAAEENDIPEAPGSDVREDPETE